MALLSAGQSAPAHTFANVLTCMYSTVSTGSGLQLRYMALIRVTKMQNNETSGRRECGSVRRQEREDGNIMLRRACRRVAVAANSDTQRRTSAPPLSWKLRPYLLHHYRGSVRICSRSTRAANRDRLLTRQASFMLMLSAAIVPLCCFSTITHAQRLIDLLKLP